jgi:hypothetical protein
MRSPGLDALISDGVLMTHEAQLLVADTWGEAGWGVDLATGVFRFGDPTPAEFGVQLLGSTAPGPRSWLWSWANPSGYSAAVTAAAIAVRALGEQYGIPELTEGEVPFDPDDEERDPRPGYLLAWDLSIAARVATRTWAGYSGEIGGGSRAWMLLEGIELPAPTAVRTSRVIAEVFGTMVVPDHRRAVSSYAAFRGLAWDGATLTLPDGAFTLTFDDLGRLSNVSGTMGPTSA